MAKPSTTHVIEIETGIGEPAFIPLTMGQELQPISVGKKGMWRIESARVLDVHAFVYFDGSALFLQSADESAAASVDGFRVGKAWTELHAPCKIEIGAARLRFRSLLAAAEPPPPPKSQTPPPPPIVEVGRVEAPLSFPKVDRAFDANVDSGRRAAMTGPQQPLSRPVHMTGPQQPLSRPPRMTGPEEPLSHSRPPPRGPQEENPTRMEGTGGRLARTGAMPSIESTMGLTPVQPIGHGQAHVNMHGGMPMAPSTMPLPAMQTGPGTVPPGMMAMGAGYPPGYGPPPGAYGGPAGPPAPGLLAKYNELSIPKRILVILAPFCLLASGYLIVFDEEPQGPPMTFRDAGFDAPLAVKTAPPPPPPPPPTPIVATGPLQPPPLGCPQGYVPYTIPIGPNGTIPCVPIGTPMPPPPQTPTVSATAPVRKLPPPLADADAGALPPTTKTLERQAVDAVAVNDYLHAAMFYEQLQERNPQNRVYAEAARILRAKADAGAP